MNFAFFPSSGSVHRFLGNTTHKDFFKLLRQDGSSLLIGARNVVYNISLDDLSENEEQVSESAQRGDGDEMSCPSGWQGCQTTPRMKKQAFLTSFLAFYF